MLDWTSILTEAGIALAGYAVGAAVHIVIAYRTAQKHVVMGVERSRQSFLKEVQENVLPDERKKIVEEVTAAIQENLPEVPDPKAIGDVIMPRMQALLASWENQQSATVSQYVRQQRTMGNPAAMPGGPLEIAEQLMNMGVGRKYRKYVQMIRAFGGAMGGNQQQQPGAINPQQAMMQYAQMQAQAAQYAQIAQHAPLDAPAPLPPVGAKKVVDASAPAVEGAPTE